jgi:hypothetical protein
MADLSGITKQVQAQTTTPTVAPPPTSVSPSSPLAAQAQKTVSIPEGAGKPLAPVAPVKPTLEQYYQSQGFKNVGNGVYRENLSGGGWREYHSSGVDAGKYTQFTPSGNTVRSATVFSTPTYNQYISAGNLQGRAPVYHTEVTSKSIAQIQSAPTTKTTVSGGVKTTTDVYGNVLKQEAAPVDTSKLPSSLVGKTLTPTEAVALGKAPVGTVTDVARAVSSGAVSGYSLVNPQTQKTEYFLTQKEAVARVAELNKSFEKPTLPSTPQSTVESFMGKIERGEKLDLTPAKVPLFDPVTGKPTIRFEDTIIPQPELRRDTKYGLLVRSDIAEQQKAQREQALIKESVPSSITSLSPVATYSRNLGEDIAKDIRNITVDTSGLPKELKESPGYAALQFAVPKVRESVARLAEFSGMIEPTTELIGKTLVTQSTKIPEMLAVGTIVTVGGMAKQIETDPVQFISDILVAKKVADLPGKSPIKYRDISIGKDVSGATSQKGLYLEYGRESIPLFGKISHPESLPIPESLHSQLLRSEMGGINVEEVKVPEPTPVYPGLRLGESITIGTPKFTGTVADVSLARGKTQGLTPEEIKAGIETHHTNYLTGEGSKLTTEQHDLWHNIDEKLGKPVTVDTTSKEFQSLTPKLQKFYKDNFVNVRQITERVATGELGSFTTVKDVKSGKPMSVFETKEGLEYIDTPSHMKVIQENIIGKYDPAEQSMVLSRLAKRGMTFGVKSHFTMKDIPLEDVLNPENKVNVKTAKNIREYLESKAQEIDIWGSIAQKAQVVGEKGTRYHREVGDIDLHVPDPATTKAELIKVIEKTQPGKGQELVEALFDIKPHTEPLLSELEVGSSYAGKGKKIFGFEEEPTVKIGKFSAVSLSEQSTAKLGGSSGLRASKAMGHPGRVVKDVFDFSFITEPTLTESIKFNPLKQAKARGLDIKIQEEAVAKAKRDFTLEQQTQFAEYVEEFKTGKEVSTEPQKVKLVSREVKATTPIIGKRIVAGVDCTPKSGQVVKKHS